MRLGKALATGVGRVDSRGRRQSPTSRGTPEGMEELEASVPDEVPVTR